MKELIFKTEPYDHQRKVVENTFNEPFFGFFAEQGTGKTKMTLDSWANLEDCPGLLVVAPNGVHANWITNEVPKHVGDVPCLLWKGGGTKAWKRRFDRLVDALKEGGRIVFAMNIESLRTKSGFAHAKEFLKANRCMMVIDESTTIKNPKALQTKRALDLSFFAAYRRILTGTPVLQGPLDLYSQIRFLDTSIWPHGSWTAFKNDFAIEQSFDAGTHTYRKIVGYRNVEKLSELINDHVIQLKKEDCLDLPDKIYMKREVELTKEQKDHYENLKSMALSVSESGEMTTATNALTMLLRLQQIVCGHLVGDDGSVTELPSERPAAMLSIIEEVPESKVIIWAHFKNDIRRIVRILRDNYGHESTVHYFGDTSQEDRQKSIKRFQEDPKCRFFVANEAASMGLTLTAADTTIYYSNNTKLGFRLQSEDRNHRIGQTKKVVYHDLVATGTVDEKVFQALQSKSDLAQLVLSGVVSLKDLLKDGPLENLVENPENSPVGDVVRVRGIGARS